DNGRRRPVDFGGAQPAQWHVPGALFRQHPDQRGRHAADRVRPAAEPDAGCATFVAATWSEETAAGRGQRTRGGRHATNRRSKTHRPIVSLAARAAKLKEEVAWER